MSRGILQVIAIHHLRRADECYAESVVQEFESCADRGFEVFIAPLLTGRAWEVWMLIEPHDRRTDSIVCHHPVMREGFNIAA